ncbi:hypothetical protein F4861DRAFT_322003 [Xylaria intraflava]|nr:hypothetical protein F4861DRAFT_322003 [Xylaria intraflava]
MESTPSHEAKRPRLSTTGSWSSLKGQGQSVSLPPVSGGSHHSHPHPHPPPPPSPYQASPSFSRPPEPPLPPAHHQPHEDRRYHHHHHDHEPFPPIQDTPRQHPPALAHPPYPPYPPRDPILKRDVSEEPGLSQLHRPSSTGHIADGLPLAPHGPPHPNQQYPDDPRRHMNFDNGVSMSHSPALYRAPNLPINYQGPPTPATQQPPYDASQGYLPPAQIYPALEIQPASAKRRPQRASQACDNCRQLKAKCDETKPCKNCREKNINCKYRDPPAKQPDKVTADILEMLTLVKDEISSIKKKVSKIDARLSNLESISIQGNPEAMAKMKLELVEEDEEPTISDGRGIPEDDATDTSTPGRTSVMEQPSLDLNDAHETLRQGDLDDIETSPGPIVAPGLPAMPPNHTTRASLLLKWKSIHHIVRGVLEKEGVLHIESYPFQREQLRGSLRIFGRGEGPDLDTRASDKGTPQDHNMTDGEDVSGAPAAGFSPGSWGQVGGLALGPGIDNKGGVLTVDGNPDWEPAKLLTYVQSFKDNMLNMHPIIIPKELDAMVRVFLAELPKSPNVPSNKASNPTVGFIQPPANVVTPETGHKRKRSPAGDEQSPVTSFRKPGRPFRSVQNTLVLLVFALGKICLHRSKIPDVVHELDDFTDSPSIRNGIPASPSQGSPAGFFPPSQSSGLPSPKENDRAIMMSRRSSLQGNVKPHRTSSTYKRNIDVIPGLEYFALASDMMGGDYGGFGLKHVHVHILAGLYHGQLGRVLESWEHIATASRKLQVELQPSLGRLSILEKCDKDSRRDNQLAFAFWTCLQLESDILAELQLPQSGILAFESQMPYPNTVFAVNNGFEKRVAEGYLAQLYLRKKLNMVHNSLYDPSKTESERQQYRAMENEIKEIQAHIKEVKKAWVPQDYYWNDEDESLPDDFLAARLRAKYWGSQVILYRPFLKLFLSPDDEESPYHNEAASPEMMTPVDVNEQNRKCYDPITIQYAELAIHALIQSTRAFHGLDSAQRLIITNVFGTAHAQWGNLLTLSACYKNPILRQFVDPNRLKDLFVRTIAFLRMNAQPSSALQTDMNILIALEKELDFAPPDDIVMKTDSSFSSTTNSTILPPIHHPSNNSNSNNNNYHMQGVSQPP